MPYDSNGVWSLTPGYLAVTGQVVSPTNHNPPLEDISTNGLSAVMVRDGRAPATGNWNMGSFKIGGLANGTLANDAVNKSQLDAAVGSPVQYVAQTLTAAQQAVARSNISAALKGQIFGVTLSNNATDAVNDIDISAGEAASTETNPVLMVLSSALTKRLDAAWAVGTGNGGLDTGSLINTWYHIYLMQRSDTGVVDACFSASPVAPTTGGSIPVAYDRFRRIGSVSREAGSLVSFRQFGDTFQRVAVTTLSSTGAFASTIITLNVPTGIVVQPLLSSLLTVNASSSVQFSLGSAWLGVVNEIWHNVVSDAGGSASDAQILSGGIFTNTSAQIYMARIITTGSAAGHSINTNGWIDLRGRT